MGAVQDQFERAVAQSLLNPQKLSEEVILVSPSNDETTVRAVIERIPEIEEKEEDGEFNEKTAIVSISTAVLNGMPGVDNSWTMKFDGDKYTVEQNNPDGFGMNDLLVAFKERDVAGGRRFEV